MQLSVLCKQIMPVGCRVSGEIRIHGTRFVEKSKKRKQEASRELLSREQIPCKSASTWRQEESNGMFDKMVDVGNKIFIP